MNAISRGVPHAAADLLPLVYNELRRLAAARLAAEPSGNTLQATALVHEAYLRLEVAVPEPREDLLALDAALSKLATIDPAAAKMV
jgi:hypothetical protein